MRSLRDIDIDVCGMRICSSMPESVYILLKKPIAECAVKAFTEICDLLKISRIASKILSFYQISAENDRKT